LTGTAVTELRRRLQADLDRLGPRRFALVFALAMASLLWLVLGLGASLWWHPPGLVSVLGNNIGRDFVSFWTASAQALAGHPEAAWDPAAHHAAEAQAIGAPVGYYAWFYPPSFLALVLPLALLPYPVGLALWLILPLIATARLLYRLMPHPLVPIAAILYPGTAQCLISGQNGLLSAAFLTGGLTALETRPVLAGLCLGALSYKPQLLAGIFVALVCGRQWRALGGAATAAATLALVSLLLFGMSSWRAFLDALPLAQAALERGEIPWARMSGFFTAARLAGLGVPAAGLIQGVVTLAALAALAWAWRRDHPLKTAVLAASIPLLTPFVYDYDLPILLPALVLLMRQAAVTGFRPAEIPLLTLLWVGPVGCWLFAQWSQLQLMPLILAGLLIILLRRTDPPQP
jgi:alpha-1,2-mannosyltransferase